METTVILDAMLLRVSVRYKSVNILCCVGQRRARRPHVLTSLHRGTRVYKGTRLSFYLLDKAITVCVLDGGVSLGHDPWLLTMNCSRGQRSTEKGDWDNEGGCIPERKREREVLSTFRGGCLIFVLVCWVITLKFKTQSQCHCSDSPDAGCHRWTLISAASW